MRDWRNEPRSCAYGGFAVLTQEEQDAWDEHEAYLIAQGQHDRSAFLADREDAHPPHPSHERETMNDELLALSAALNAAIVEPLLAEKNREETIRDFGMLGLDILTRWNREFKATDGEPIDMSNPGAVDVLRAECRALRANQ